MKVLGCQSVAWRGDRPIRLLSSPLKGHEMKQKQKNSIPDWLRPRSPMAALPTGWFQGGGTKCFTGTKPSIRLLMKGTAIRTWNDCSLHACGKLHKLIYELNHYHWDIMGLAEVRWTGFSKFKTDESHNIWFSADDTKHEHEVTFIIWKEVTGNVISCTLISSRLILICISAKPHNITIIQTCVPVTDYEDEDAEVMNS